MKIKIKKITKLDIPVPSQATEGDAGFDLYAARRIVMVPNSQAILETGYAFEIPHAYVGIIKERSSMAQQRLYTSAGVIDSSYRGEIKVCIRNDSDFVRTIRVGDKFAQMLLVLYLQGECEVVDELGETDRGVGGFGHTGG